MAPWISSHKRSDETHLEFRSEDAHLNLDSVYSDKSKGHKKSSAILFALKLRRTQLYLRNFMNRQMRHRKLFLGLFVLVLYLIYNHYAAPSTPQVNNVKNPVEKVVAPDEKGAVPVQKVTAEEKKEVLPDDKGAVPVQKAVAEEHRAVLPRETEVQVQEKPKHIAPRPPHHEPSLEAFDALGELFALPEDESIKWWTDTFPEQSSGNRVKVLVIINSQAGNIERRSALRKTWVGRCRKWAMVSCLFFIDGKLDTTYINKIIEENSQYKDIHLTPTAENEKTPKRFLYQLSWARRVYNFEYVMTIDDDMMLCFDRLIQDFKTAPRSKLIWSRVHCETPIIRPEDSMMLISRDLVELFLRQPLKSMQCHPKPDQQVAIWAQQLKLANKVGRVAKNMGVYYSDNSRIHRNPNTKDTPAIKNGFNLCHKYLAIRWRHTSEAQELWRNRGSDRGFEQADLRNKCEAEDEFQQINDIYDVKPELCSHHIGSRDL